MFTKKLVALIASALTAGALLAMPATALAQRRGFARGPAFRPHSRFVFVGGFGYGLGYPFYDGAFGDPFWQYGYPPYPYPTYGAYGYGSAAMRIQVTPKQAEVYVDGYRAGIVDDFDGIFQRLYIPPGGHRIVLYLPGYKTVTQDVYLTPNNTQKIQLTMAPVAPGETSEPPAPPQPPAELPAQARPGLRMMPPVQVPNGGAPPPEPGMPPAGVSAEPMPPPPPPPPTDPAAYGSLTLRIEPGSTLVLIDGQRWAAPGSGSALVVRLGEGTHHVQISRPGYVTFSQDVDIKRGESTTLEVKLTR